MLELPTLYDKLNAKTRKEVRDKYIELQNNRCWYCGRDLDGLPPKEVSDKPVSNWMFPIGFFKSKIHLQHDPDTGLTEGAVHSYCNAVLWEYFGR
ncbi:hypothetical protein BH09PAT1_BH09PAT1_2820 [soil metagenome]